MAKYLVETYYTCNFKTSHYLDNVNEKELSNLEKRDDGKFEVLEVKLDNRKTKSLDSNNKLTKFSKTLEKVCIETVESGSMTKDLAILVGKSTKYLTTNKFLEAINSNFKKSLN